MRQPVGSAREPLVGVIAVLNHFPVGMGDGGSAAVGVVAVAHRFIAGKRYRGHPVQGVVRLDSYTCMLESCDCCFCHLTAAARPDRARVEADSPIGATLEKKAYVR